MPFKRCNSNNVAIFSYMEKVHMKIEGWFIINDFCSYIVLAILTENGTDMGYFYLHYCSIKCYTK